MSGTTAGEDWARKNQISQADVDSYSGNSESFRQGMQNYIDSLKASDSFQQETGEPNPNQIQ